MTFSISGSRPTSLPPPRPPSRGILKSKSASQKLPPKTTNLDDPMTLLENTRANTEYHYENLRKSPVKSPAKSPVGGDGDTLSPVDASADRDVDYVNVAPVLRVRAHADHVSPVSPVKTTMARTVSSVSAGEIKAFVNGESIGMNQRPLSTDFTIHLPSVRGQNGDGSEDEKEIVLKRTGETSSGGFADFGIGVKKVTLNRTGGRRVEGESVLAVEQTVTSGSSVDLDLCPGDYLVEVNGDKVPVNSDRESVVQAVKELVGTGVEELKIKVRLVSRFANKILSRFRELGIFGSPIFCFSGPTDSRDGRHEPEVKRRDIKTKESQIQNS